jgi:hypothetical protein
LLDWKHLESVSPAGLDVGVLEGIVVLIFGAAPVRYVAHIYSIHDGEVFGCDVLNSIDSRLAVVVRVRNGIRLEGVPRRIRIALVLNPDLLHHAAPCGLGAHAAVQKQLAQLHGGPSV